ncbi:MAG: LysM peptidoglycan-binding domain-containing protein [Thiotrichales bacterium]|nr:MAG: LysM peptidoglycan-binding domain-containing protein [Thiotrichales bacterium]
MKISVTPVCVHPIRTYSLTLLLAAGLIGCSSSSTKEDDVYVEPDPQPVVVAEPEQPQQEEIQQQAVAASVKVNHPRQYVVQKGDTLWDIASLFLKDPWFWPEIWYQNPQVENPHLIFPGDILTLIYVDGQPRIVVGKRDPELGVVTQQRAAVVEDDQGVLPVVKLSPTIRSEAIESSIDTIPGDAIRQFLTKPRVVTKEEFKDAPYILGSDDPHLILGQGNNVYIRGEIDKERVRYTVVREGEKLTDPDTKEVLGYEAIYAGEVLINTYGDPAVGELTFTEREVLFGDRLLPTDKSKIDNIYFPRLPDRDLQGRIIHLPDALFGVAKLQVAVVNKGSRDGLESGNLLAIYTKGMTVHDHYNRGKKVDLDLPDVRSGLMMIFRTFDNVSYGLVLESTRVIHENDMVRTPK